jgi:hypothetical protein
MHQVDVFGALGAVRRAMVNLPPRKRGGIRALGENAGASARWARPNRSRLCLSLVDMVIERSRNKNSQKTRCSGISGRS